MCLYGATFFSTTQESVSGSDNAISGVTVLFSFFISKHSWCACLDLAGQCDRISQVGISRQTLPVQPGPLAWPLSLCQPPCAAKTPWVSHNRYIFSLPELKWRECWTWARAGRAAGPQGAQNKPLRGPSNGNNSSPFFSQGRPGFSSLLLPDTLSASSPCTPVFLLLGAHSHRGHASPLLYAVLIPGPIVTDQKACVPVPYALARTAGCLSLGRERGSQ